MERDLGDCPQKVVQGVKTYGRADDCPKPSETINLPCPEAGVKDPFQSKKE